MKGEYSSEDKDHHTPIMFPKIHQTQKFQSYPSTAQHHFEPHSPTTKKEQSSAGNDGASIEISRRPRGRPPGSKNKPKPPVIITRDSEPSMSPYVLEIPAGSDIVSSLSVFCRKRHSGLCILNGSGTVANVTIKQPSSTPGATVTFHGRFDILSVSGSVLPSFSGQIGNNFTISLAGPQGQIVGGAVVGPLVAAGTVYVIAASFNNPTYHRLPLEEESEQTGNNNNNNGGGGGGDVAAVRSPSGVSGGGDSGHGPTSAAGEMSMYSCHLPADVVWAPTPRQPPPPY